MPESFFNKERQACNVVKKEILAQVFFYEFCEILRTPFVATGIPPDDCFCITRVKERNQSSEMKISKILMIPIIDSAL